MGKPIDLNAFEQLNKAPADNHSANDSSIVTFDPMRSEYSGPEATQAALSDQTNTGSIYSGKTDEQANQLYKAQGNPLIPGMDNGPRTMKRNDEQGNVTTEFVMPPEKPLSAPKDGLGLAAQDLSTVMREGAKTVARGATMAARGTLGAGEYALDQARDPGVQGLLEKSGVPGIAPAMAGLNSIVDLADKYLGTKIGDPKTNFATENIPVTPVSNDAEKFIGDMVSMAIGGHAGGKLVEEGTKEIPGIIRSFFSKADALDPKTAYQKTEAFAKAIATRTGEAAGATATQPPNTQPITGSNFLDNLILTQGLGAGGDMLKATGKGAKAVFPGLLNASDNPTNIVRQWMTKIDPALEKASDADILKHAQMFGEIADKNKKFQTGLSRVENGDVNLDTVTSMAMSDGAREYFIKSRGLSPKDLTPEIFNDTVDKGASDILENLREYKRGRLLSGSVPIKRSDSHMQGQLHDLLTEQADNLSDAPVANSRVTNMAQEQVVNPLNDAREALKNTHMRQTMADANLQNEQMSNALTPQIEQARQMNALGSTTEEKQQLVKLGTQELPKAHNAEWNQVKQAYANLKPNVPYDADTLAKFILDTHDEGKSLKALGLPENDTFTVPGPKLAADGKTIITPQQQLAEQIKAQFPDTKSLMNQVIPELSNRVDAGFTNAAGKAVTSTTKDLESLRNYITDMSKEADPQVAVASKMYGDFAQRWLQSEPMQNFHAKMSQIHDTPSGIKGQDQAQMAGFSVVDDAMKNDPTGIKTKKLMDVLPTAGPDMQNYYVSKAIARAAIGDQPVSSQALIDAIQPMLDQMHNVNPSIEANFKQAVQVLKDAEMGKVTADEAHKVAFKAAQDAITVTNDNALSNWVVNSDKAKEVLGELGPEVTKNPETVFKRVFSSDNSPATIQRLYAAMGDNQPAKDGVKSQFIRYLRDKGYSTNPTGVQYGEGGNLGFTTAPKSGTISNMFQGGSVESLANAVFEGDANEAKSVLGILDLALNKANLDNAKPFTKGSDTVINKSLTDSVRTATTFIFGQLSRPAAAINRFAKLVFGDDTAIRQENIDKIVDAMIVDPKWIGKAVEMAKNDNGAGLDALAKWIVDGSASNIRGAVGGYKDVVKPHTTPNLDQQTNDVLNSDSKFTKHLKTGTTSNDTVMVPNTSSNGPAKKQQGFVTKDRPSVVAEDRTKFQNHTYGDVDGVETRADGPRGRTLGPKLAMNRALKEQANNPDSHPLPENDLGEKWGASGKLDTPEEWNKFKTKLQSEIDKAESVDDAKKVLSMLLGNKTALSANQDLSKKISKSVFGKKRHK